MSSKFPPVMILAGGRATRLGDIARDIPKAMVPVAGRPFIDHQLSLLARNGVSEVVLCVSHLHEQIESHVGDGNQFGLRVQYSLDGSEPLGTGGALLKAAHLVGADCAVLYGDSYLDIDYAEVYTAFLQSGRESMMTFLENANRWDKSNVLFESGRVVAYDKTGTVPGMKHIDFGLVLLKRDALLRINAGQPSDFGDLFKVLIAENQMAGFEVSNRFYEIGTPDGLTQTEEYLTVRR